MSADPVELRGPTAAGTVGVTWAEGPASDEPAPPEPFYFPAGEDQLFGWLHPAVGGKRSEWGVVLCNAFGYEAHCGHRSARAFADAASALGMPALRFDYLGTGDSADIDPVADQIEAWSRDIIHAVIELRQRTGVERVCLLGFRLGALLATLAAARCGVEALILVAPVLSGRRFLKEARTLQLAADAAQAAASGGAVPTWGAEPPAGSGVIELSGHPLSAASIASLKQLEAQAGGMPGVSTVLLLDREDLPSAREWGQALARADVRVDYQMLPGFVEMMMTPPHLGTVPREMLDATRHWLSSIAKISAPSRPSRQSDASQAELPAAARQLALGGEDDSAAARLTERPLFLTPDRTVFGIVTEPRRNELRRRAVIIPNSGAEYHVGACRAGVLLARKWARRGYHVLRMDLSGLGDTRTRPGRRDDEVFPVDALADMGAAMELMKTRYRIREFTFVGFCSGGYHSLRAAVAGLPVNRLLMVNVQNFFWDQSMKTDGLQLGEVVRNPAIFRERVFSAAAWKRLLTGRMNVLHVLGVYLDFSLLPLKSRARNLARLLGIRLRNDLGHELQEIITRGVRATFIFSHGEPGIDLLAFEAGSVRKRLGQRLRLRIVHGADHVFSRSGPRALLEQVLSEELFACEENTLP